GLYILNTKDVDIINNSMNLAGYNGWACYVTGSSGFSDSLRFVNNIFSAGGTYQGAGGQALRVNSAGVVQQMDYNLFYTTGPSLAYYAGTTFLDLATFQLGFPQFNQNSVEDIPGFVSPTDLHIVCSNIDDLGTYVGIPDDFDNQARSVTTPDMGADEFTGITISMDLGADTSHCGRMSLWGDTTNYVGFIWGGGQTSQFIYVDTTGTYSLQVIDSNNCRATDSLMVTINDAPNLVYENDTIGICTYDTISAGNTGSTYQWSTGDVTQEILPPGSGTYYVTVTTQHGCQGIDTVTVTQFADAVAQLGADTTFCLGAGALLDAGAGPTGTAYTWSSGASTQVILVTAPGDYAVTVTTPQGCEASDTVSMNALLAPTVNLGPDRTECDSWTLDAGNAGSSFQWSTGDNSQTISGATPGTYIVTVTNAQGCESVDQVILAVGTTPTVSLGANPVICDGQAATLDAGNPGFAYNWSNGATTQSINVTSGGTYIVDVTDPSSNCVGSDTISVIQSFLTVNLGPDFILCDGSSATLDAGSGAVGYLWNDGSTTQTLSVNTSGTYTVQATDNLGCVATDDITVTSATLPTANFTSNGSVPLFQTITFNDLSGAGVTSWSWDFGDGNSSTQQNPSHNYVATGVFSVCLTVSDGTCTNTFCQDVAVKAPVSIEDEVFAGNVDVFPNPNTGQFSIDFDLPKFLDVDIMIVSVTGQKVYESTVNGVRVHREAIDLGSVSKGMYFMRLISNKGDEMITKIMVD
ncbi:MAG: PKD domain-containing protein, partial [Bacteroidota bacterium]